MEVPSRFKDALLDPPRGLLRDVFDVTELGPARWIRPANGGRRYASVLSNRSRTHRSGQTDRKVEGRDGPVQNITGRTFHGSVQSERLKQPGPKPTTDAERRNRFEGLPKAFVP